MESYQIFSIILCSQTNIAWFDVNSLVKDEFLKDESPWASPGIGL